MIETEDSIQDTHIIEPVNIKKFLQEENMSRSGKVFSLERMMGGNKVALQTPRKVNVPRNDDIKEVKDPEDLVDNMEAKPT